jgi:hypothetical protein
MKQLETWLIDEAASSGDREVFENVISNAADEAVIQKYLIAHPQLFRIHLRGNLGNAVIPWPRLGAEFVPDFLLVEADSAGLHWTLVELESPTKKMLNTDGKLAPKTREAIAQIEVWREWLNRQLGLCPASEERARTRSRGYPPGPYPRSDRHRTTRSHSRPSHGSSDQSRPR